MRLVGEGRLKGGGGAGDRSGPRPRLPAGQRDRPAGRPQAGRVLPGRGRYRDHRAAGRGRRPVNEALAATFRAEWPRLVAAAMRLVGDLQAAEDVVQDVLVSALDRWPLTGVPDRPAAWLMTACRNRALNVLRDSGRARDRALALAPLLAGGDEPDPPTIDD